MDQRAKKEKDAKQEKREVVVGHKTEQLERLICKRNRLLALTKMPKAAFTGFCILAIALGFVLGKLMFQDTLLSCAMSIAALSLPFLYLEFLASKTRAYRLEKLENTMNIITNAYLASNDLIQSVQENIHLLDIREPFEQFLLDISCVDCSIDNALFRLSARIADPFFSQWCDILLLSQTDRKMNCMLPTIITQMNDLRQDQMEADTTMVSIWHDYLTMLALVCFIPIFFRLGFYEWYQILVGTFGGRCFMLALIASILFSLKKAIEINRPLTA